MSRFAIFAAVSLMATVSPALASQTDPEPGHGAPQASEGARYCLRIEPTTGSRIEQVQFETRWEWSLLGVDVDKEWAKEGVRVIG